MRKVSLFTSFSRRQLRYRASISISRGLDGILVPPSNPSQETCVHSASENDPRPNDVRTWEKTMIPLLLAFIMSTDDYAIDNTTKLSAHDENLEGNEISPL